MTNTSPKIQQSRLPTLNELNPYPSDLLFPLQPTPPPHPHPDKPPGRHTPESLILVHFGPFRACFGPVSGPFQVHLGSVSGCWVWSGRGASAREKNITTVSESQPHRARHGHTKLLGD